MIAKIRTGSFLKGAFQYNIGKVEEGKAAFFYSSMFKNNFPAPDFKAMQKELSEIISFCPSVSKPVFHTSLNFSPDEHLDDETLQLVINDYMEKIGYGNTPYVVFKHTDVNHQHVHIISINIEKKANGRYGKIPDNYLHLRSQAISRALEKKYNLIVATDKKEKRKVEIPNLKQYGEVDTFSQIGEVVDYIFNRYIFYDLIGLNSLLKSYNLVCFKNTSRSGEPYYKFTFQHQGKNIGVGGTAKQLGLNYSFNQINELFYNNKVKTAQIIEKFEFFRKELLDNYFCLSMEDFNKIMLKSGYMSIDNDRYLNIEKRVVVSRHSLGFPKRFINEVSLKKEYFTHITKSATAYRKKMNIFHESTMYLSPDLINGFRTFFKREPTHLSNRQKQVLLDNFLMYKQNRKNEILKKEEEKDLKLVQKMFRYTQALNLDWQTTKALLEKFHVHIRENGIFISNSTDTVLHELKYSDLGFYQNHHYGNNNKFAQLNSLTEHEFLVIEAAVNNKPCYLDYGVKWENIKPFIPEDYAQRYNLESQLTDRVYSEPVSGNNEDINTSDVISRPLLGATDNYMPAKRKKKDDDEDDELCRRRRRKRRKI